MMKKISKLALLAAATAFLLAGFPACSNDGDDGNSGSTPTDTAAPASFELTSGAEPTATVFTLTLGTTQINEAGLKALKKDADLTKQISDIVSQSGSDITVSALKVAEDATATTLKLSVTMASDAAAGATGTITLTLPEDFTANGKAVEMTLSYTIKGNTTTPTTPDENDPKDPPASATAKTYNFVGLTISDFPAGSLNKKDDGAALTAFVSGADNYIKTKTEVAVNGATLYGGKNNLRIRVTDNASTAVNYNGGESADITNGATISNLSRWVKIPVDGAGTVTASIKAVNSSTNSGTLQIALVDKDGKRIGDLVTANVADGKITGTDDTTGTVTGSVAAATDVYLVLSRNGANGGGMDVYSITVAPATN